MEQMTKSEAFDFLKNTKVKVNPEQSEKIQEMLEEEEVCIITKGNYLTMTK